MIKQIGTKGKYTLLEDTVDNGSEKKQTCWGIVEVLDTGARFIVKPESLYFRDEVEKIWHNLTEKRLSSKCGT